MARKRKQRGYGSVFRGRRRQRGKKQRGGMKKEAMSVVKSLRNFTAKNLQKLAKTVKPKGQKGGFWRGGLGGFGGRRHYYEM